LKKETYQDLMFYLFNTCRAIQNNNEGDWHTNVKPDCHGIDPEIFVATTLAFMNDIQRRHPFYRCFFKGCARDDRLTTG
jgi:hypothetical protein